MRRANGGASGGWCLSARWATVLVGVLALSGYSLDVDSQTPKVEKQANPDVKLAAEGNTAFALDLFAQLGRSPGNLAFSPYSLSTALAMTYGGARGETAEQMAKVLHFDLGQQKLHPALAELAQAIQAKGNKNQGSLDVANALWGQSGERFLPPFLALMVDDYKAGLRQVDFRKDAEQVRAAINSWVADQTRQKITELLKEGDVDASTLLVLVNAIYFRAVWMTPFDPKFTQEEEFRLDAQQAVKVPMMHLNHTFPMAAIGQDLSLIELPYAGGDLSMVILLPSKQDGLAELESSLNVEKLKNWLGQMRPADLRLSLPRFKLDARFSLSRVLAAMGMPDAFAGSKADFSGMNGLRHRLCISNVIHHAVVEVDEQGTKAAAATAVTMLRGAPIRKEFIVNHPFVFLIRDQQTGSILFIGRVADPLK